MLPVFSGDMLRKAGKRFVPESVKPRPHLGEAAFIDLVEIAGAVSPVAHQTGSCKDPKMLRDRRAANREPAGDLADRHRSTPKLLEDLPARPVS